MGSHQKDGKPLQISYGVRLVFFNLDNWLQRPEFPSQFFPPEIYLKYQVETPFGILMDAFASLLSVACFVPPVNVIKFKRWIYKSSLFMLLLKEECFKPSFGPDFTTGNLTEFVLFKPTLCSEMGTIGSSAI